MSPPNFRATLACLGLAQTGPNGFGAAVQKIGGTPIPDRTVQGYATTVDTPPAVDALLRMMESSPDAWWRSKT